MQKKKNGEYEESHKKIKYYKEDFHSDGLLEKTKAFNKDIFTHSVEVVGSMYFGNIFRIMTFSRVCTIT